MSQNESPILQVIEVISSDTLMMAFNRRMLGFLRNGVEEYWAVSEEMKEIHVYRCKESRPYPPDWKQTVTEFFAPQGSIER
jgi:hypothetical protein